jgi:hypothetical protein
MCPKRDFGPPKPKKSGQEEVQSPPKKKKRGRTVKICYLHVVQSGNTPFMGWLKAYQKNLHFGSY